MPEKDEKYLDFDTEMYDSIYDYIKDSYTKPFSDEIIIKDNFDLITALDILNTTKDELDLIYKGISEKKELKENMNNKEIKEFYNNKQELKTYYIYIPMLEYNKYMLETSILKYIESKKISKEKEIQNIENVTNFIDFYDSYVDLLFDYKTYINRQEKGKEEYNELAKLYSTIKNNSYRINDEDEYKKVIELRKKINNGMNEIWDTKWMLKENEKIASFIYDEAYLILDKILNDLYVYINKYRFGEYYE